VSKTDTKTTDYAYAFEWHHYLAPKLLNQLLSKHIKAKVAAVNFTSQVQNKKHLFASGTIIIPAAIQSEPNWRAELAELAITANIELFVIKSGLTSQGIDFGSGSFKPLNL
jgi:hypothetical protein